MKAILRAAVHCIVGFLFSAYPVVSEVRSLDYRVLASGLEIEECHSQLPLLHRRVTVDDFQSYDVQGQTFSEFRPALYSAGHLSRSRGIYIFDEVRDCLRAIHRSDGGRFAVHSDPSLFISSLELSGIYENLLPAMGVVQDGCDMTISIEEEYAWYLNGSQDIPYCWIYAMARRLDFLFEFERRVFL